MLQASDLYLFASGTRQDHVVRRSQSKQGDEVLPEIIADLSLPGALNIAIFGHGAKHSGDNAGGRDAVNRHNLLTSQGPALRIVSKNISFGIEHLYVEGKPRQAF